jgi:PAS domain S-box-containing protein
LWVSTTKISNGIILSATLVALLMMLATQQVLLGCIFIFLAFVLLTERRRSQDLVQGQLQFLQKIIDAIPSPVFYKDADGKYLGCNKIYETFIGLSREQILGKTVHELWPKELADRYREKDQELLENSGIQVYESLAQSADGTPHNIIFNKALFRNQDGSVGGLVGVINDITERKAAEQERSALEAQLHHSSMMESLMVQLGHDLKTPLTPLFALLPLVRKRAGDPKLERMLDICQGCVSQIQGLTGKALELARLSSQTGLIERVPVRLRDIAEHCMSGSAALFAERGINCGVSIDPGLQVLGADEQLKLLFDNLLSNAARYAAENGVIRIRAACTDAAVTVSVQDDGVGLQPGHAPLIFHEFFKADSARHDLDTQGLGLAICRRIISNHGGMIWAESAGCGMGTTVSFTLTPAPPAQIPRDGRQDA